MKLEENKLYTCPCCESADVVVSMFCSVNANDVDEVEVDFESNVGDSSKWYCEDCGESDFLPIVEDIEETETQPRTPAAVEITFSIPELNELIFALANHQSPSRATALPLIEKYRERFTLISRRIHNRPVTDGINVD